ncbi:Putative methylated-DNA-[protein]-cysteine S-methyltransferase, DNA binding protein [Septoria linicola]|uniref:Methylated-DNA-[protein]-cysteine S-methyltransferase, DNA binding protein n=1 Tax=Septoria linicola TaxID=215465 RepID=A0A9Q9B2W7_9PEZI|nr:putative methylated-DNA-[protein]-cysteine S-methyltransferase, DNA binding protein [Septoria linicola]USW55361.1 Putative methylated-DNA-[protein]-cysteine S-methyltransferase, DNA binding protein [Septoria linicola]
MPRSDEAAAWYTMVYRAVQQVPYGSVTSYGHIANLLGYPGANGAATQETALLAEGVEVGRGSLGERTVDFSTFGWFPNVLPSEGESREAEADEQEEL